VRSDSPLARAAATQGPPNVALFAVIYAPHFACAAACAAPDRDPARFVSAEIITLAAAGGRRVVLRSLTAVARFAGFALAHACLTDARARFGWRMKHAGAKQWAIVDP